MTQWPGAIRRKGMTGRKLSLDWHSERRDAARSPAIPAGESPPSLLRWLRGNPAGFLGALILFALIASAILAPWLTPYDPLAVDVQSAMLGMSWEHPLGTDHLGRDMMSRLIYGARASLGAAIAVVAVVTLISVVVGTAAGFFGGWLDEIVMRIIDVLLAMPSFILALVVAGFLGPGLMNVIIALIMVRWSGLARVVRGLALSLREQHYILAARSVGASDVRIMVRHILPNVMGPVIVIATLNLGSVILSLSGLSFIGLGVQLPHPEWGAMLNYARVYMETEPRLMVLPGIAIALSVLSANLLGDALRDYWDPRGRRESFSGGYKGGNGA